MSYQWGPQGPAFEYPTCFRIENRFLTLRAAVLLLVALALLWVALSEPEALSGTTVLPTRLQRGSPVPHVVVAVLLIVLGLLDLWSAARQRKLRLFPGQPAPLTNDLVRQSKGISAGAAWLSQVIASGSAPRHELRGLYRGLMASVAPRAAEGPLCLQDFLSVRLAHLLFGVGALMALALTWVFVVRPPSAALATLIYSVLAMALVARSAWITRAAPSPVALAVALILAALAGVLIGVFGAAVPGLERLVQMGVTTASAVLLCSLLVIEGLGLLAARVAVDPPPQGGLSPAEATVEVAADPERLMQEVERELHRYWVEGIPNRRHAWQTALADPKAESGRFTATVLEEAQPVLPPEQRDGIDKPGAGRQHWLVALDVLGLVLTLAGCLLWLRMANAKMSDGSAPWSPAALSLVLLMAGDYALRVGHLLWSRVEVESTLLGLACQSVGVERAAAAAGNLVDQVKLRMTVVRARSVFYAAADHQVGHRTLLRLTGDEAAARRSVQQVQAYAQRQPLPGDDRAPAAGSVVAPSPAMRPSTPVPFAPPAQAPAAPRLQARFCSSCGTSLVPGARFCQRCGEPQRSN